MDNTTLIAILLMLLLGVVLYRLQRLCLQASRADWGSGLMNRIDGLNRLFCRYYHRLPPVELGDPRQRGLRWWSPTISPVLIRC